MNVCGSSKLLLFVPCSLALVAALFAPSPAYGATYTVNSTADDDDGGCDPSPDDCTLREAINVTNLDAALDTIEFNIGPGTPIISVGAAGLPAITQPLMILGNTGGATRVELSGVGTNAGVDGLSISGGGSTIRRLVINRFADDGIAIVGPAGGNNIEGSFIGTNAAGDQNRANGDDGVWVNGSPGNTIGGTGSGAGNLLSGNSGDFGVGVVIEGAGATGNVVEGNLIGTDVAGTGPLPNGFGGVNVQSGASDNTVGGTTVAARNIISGNVGHAVQISGPTTTGNVVQGNFIGTDVTGNFLLSNSFFGVLISQAPGNTIGGTEGTTPGGACTGACNLISGNNGLYGVNIRYSQATGNTVQGNFIGTNVAGTAALRNTGDGVAIDGASDNIIGGTTAAARNLISGNLGIFTSGVHILAVVAATATGNQVQGNFIGTDTTGTAILGNPRYGVWLDGVSDNTIGGTAGGAGNTIAFNGNAGVFVSAGTGNAVLGNSTFANAGLGIDLGTSGVTANDGGDGDPGANNLQNFPVLDSATSGSVTIRGSLDSAVGTTFRIEFFSNTACDISGHGEGQTFLGSTSVTTNGSGIAGIDVTFPATVPAGHFISATATDPGKNTSELSECEVVAPDADGDAVADGSDNCPAWPNPAQTLPPWPVPAGDSDCDGFTDAAEGVLATDAADQCPDNATDDAWPPDINKSGAVSVTDVLFLKPSFGQSVPPAPARHDIVPSGAVNITDVVEFKKYFGLACT